MGRYDVETRKGKRDTGLVKFEARNTMGGAFAPASDWVTYAFAQFALARIFRARATGKGETGLELSE